MTASRGLALFLTVGAAGAFAHASGRGPAPSTTAMARLTAISSRTYVKGASLVIEASQPVAYVATRPDAWETPAMKKYVAEFPAAAVARDQLQYSVAELSTHDNQRVTKALNDGLQAALTGAKTSEQAMKDAQREAERLLRSYKK